MEGQTPYYDEEADREKNRPRGHITLLSTVYKVSAKALDLRLQPCLNELILSMESNLVKHCCILDLLGDLGFGRIKRRGSVFFVRY